jgi:TolB-like protein
VSQLLTLLSLSFVLTSCAYSFGYKDRDLPGGYSEVAIPVFENQTPEVGIESYFTNSIIEEFARSKRIQVIDQRDAPVRLEGVIVDIKFQRSALAEGTGKESQEVEGLPDETILTTEYRVRVTAQVYLRRLSDQKIIWSGAFKGEDIYTAPQVGSAGVNSANALYNHSARRQVVQGIANDMMAEAYRRVTERF